MRAEEGFHSATLRDYLRVVRRRKWIILQAVVLVPLAAAFFSLRQETLHQASAEVLLSRQNLAASLTGTPDTIASQPADRVAQTQADLARVPQVARRVLKASGLLSVMTPEKFLARSSVSPRQNADLLVFRVEDPSPVAARRLATEYARQFTIYRRQLDTAPLVRARKEVQARIRELRAAGDRRSRLYASLVEKEQQLGTLEALQTSNAFLVRAADGASQVQPRPVRNAVLGLALGLVLGIGLAFLREALDTRVRSAEEIGERLGGLPLLARLPAPPRRLSAENTLVMLAAPHSVGAEAFRMLRTNLDFVRLDRDARTVMITSAVEQEGKSTTAANLAVALSRAGQRVVLVDLDLRRPFLDRFFRLDGRPGLTQVALGHVALDEALASVAILDLEGSRRALSRFKGNDGEESEFQGALEVLPSGPIPPDPGEFVGTRALEEILSQLRDRADVVVIDAPPLLHVGDAMTLSAKVDALIVVAHINILRRPMITELKRLLEAAPAGKLGFVLAAAESEEGYGYGYGYASHFHRPWHDASGEQEEEIAR